MRTTATNPRTWRRACRASDTPTRTSRARRRGCAGSSVMWSECRTWTWCRYQITNNHYQSANVTLGLSCQHDADMSVTDTAARVRGEWRHAVAMSNADTEPLSEYEQPLPIRECDIGMACRRVTPFCSGTRDTVTHIGADKQKSRFIVSDLICRNVYVLAEKSMQRLIANIAQFQMYVNI